MKRKNILTCFLLAAVLLTFFPLSGCADKKIEPLYVTSPDELAYAKIGLVTGTIFDTVIESNFPGATMEYLNTNFDILTALDTGKIAACVCDQPFAEQMVREKGKYAILEKLADDNYGFFFPKDSEKSELLRAQINEFLTKARRDGVLDEVKELWLSPDDEKKDIDFDSLTGENGTLKFGISADGTEPFALIKGGKPMGYDVDVAVRFCREYGYDIEVTDYAFSGLLAAIASEKVDFGGSGISITPERENTFMFSDPIFNGGIVVMVNASAPKYASFEELNGKRAGVITGSSLAQNVTDCMPDTEIQFFNSAADLAMALNSDKIDFYAVDEPVGRCLLLQNGNQVILGNLQDDHYGAIFRKNDEKGTFLCDQVNRFLAKIRADGTIHQIINDWIGTVSPDKTVDYENLTPENGVINCGVSTNVGAPYVYIKDGKYVGYEVEIMTAFCREYGYGIKFFDTDFSGILSSVASGKCDVGVSGISITPERQESMLFSDPIYDGGVAVIVKKQGISPASVSFLSSVITSFEKTFIRESRWKMFLSGIAITMLITVISAVCGSVIGFAFFLIYRKKNRIAVTVFDLIGDFSEKMPVVVILMILYYIVFGSIDISGILVSVTGFTFLFSFNVLGLIKSGVGAVDKGQTEAALALGYTDNQAFMKMIFPQAVKHFMPGYKSALVSLVKDTSVVGYIAIQDLTKISDIVRSRTYEAFFPLIATAVIYFLLAFILTSLIKKVEISFDPARRKEEKILKGVKTK